MVPRLSTGSLYVGVGPDVTASIGPICQRLQEEMCKDKEHREGPLPC